MAQFVDSHSHVPDSYPSWVRPAAYTAAGIALAVLAWSIWNGEAVQRFKEEAGPVRYFAAMAILPALGMPLTPLFVVAGATFGTRIAIIGSAIALGLNLALCYWISTSALRPRLAALLKKFKYELPDFETENTGMMRFVVLVKLMPGVPGFAKNYLLGVASVPFWPYFLMSMLFTGLYAVVLVVLGESLAEHDTAHIAIVVAVIACLVVGIRWLKRRRGRADAD